MSLEKNKDTGLWNIFTKLSTLFASLSSPLQISWIIWIIVGLILLALTVNEVAQNQDNPPSEEPPLENAKVYPETGSDKEGNEVDFNVIIIDQSFRWKFNSSDTVMFNDKEKPFSEFLSSKGFQNEVKKYKYGIIFVGTSSQSGENIKREVIRAEERAVQLMVWFKENTENWPDLYTLNLGKYSGSNQDDPKQRSIIILGIIENINNANLKEASIDAMRNSFEDKSIAFPFNPDEYKPEPVFEQGYNSPKSINPN